MSMTILAPFSFTCYDAADIQRWMVRYENARNNGEEKDDDHDQDFLSEDVLHIWSWSSEKLLLKRRRTMTMSKIPSGKPWYTYGHGPLIIYFK